MEVINNIPSSNSNYALLFLIIATLGTALIIAGYWVHYQAIGAVSLLCQIYAIYFVADSLRKGIQHLNKVTKGLLVITEVLIIAKLVMTIAVWIMNFTGTFYQQLLREHVLTTVFTQLVTTLYTIPLFIACLILSIKYKGAVRNISLLYIFISIGSFILISCPLLIAIVTGSEQTVSVVKDVATIIANLAMYALFFLAYKAIACKNKTLDNQANQTT